MVINQFTYKIPEALANIPKTAQLTAEILEYNIQSLDKIYALNPDDKSAQRERASNYSRVGNLYLDLLGNVDKALDYYQQALTITEQIAKKDPNNTQAQLDLEISYEKMGDVNSALGKSNIALEAYQKEFDILKKLADDDKSNMAAQWDLFVSYTKLGMLYQQLKQNQLALPFFNQALPIAEKLAEDKINQQAQQDLQWLQNKLQALDKTQ